MGMKKYIFSLPQITGVKIKLFIFSPALETSTFGIRAIIMVLMPLFVAEFG